MGRLAKSFRHAFAGLGHVLRTEKNAQIHLLAAVLALGLGVWLEVGPANLALLLLTSGSVFAFELLNTMVETLVDLVAPNPQPLAGTAKDIAAGAVLVSALVALGVGLCILGPPLVRLLR